MFFTRPEYAEWLPPLEGYKGCLGWGIVEMAARLPWFLLEVTVRDDQGEPESRRTLLVSRMSTLVGALKAMSGGSGSRVSPYRVVGFYPPGWEAAPDAWTSRLITEIWDAQVEGEEAPHELWLLRTSDGQELLEPDVEADKVRKVRRIFADLSVGKFQC